MSFWSSEKVHSRVGGDGLIQPFESTRVKHGGYELGLGPEYFITSSDGEVKQAIQENEQIKIPPGQFGLLLTEEMVKIPDNAIGFISIKAGIKFFGLVNVSGFHVDPGFSGRLQFSVYNAGAQNIVLERKSPVFIIWFADLDQKTTDTYKGKFLGKKSITSQDVMRIQGKVASPASLNESLKKLESEVTLLKTWFGGALVSIVVGIILLPIRGCFEKTGQAATNLPGLEMTPNINAAKTHFDSSNVEVRKHEKESSLLPGVKKDSENVKGKAPESFSTEMH